MTVRKSTEMKRLSRTLRADREPRKQKIDEPVPDSNALLVPPSHISEGAQSEWKRLAPLALKMNTLTIADCRTFELLCETLATGENARRLVELEGYTVATAANGAKTHPAVRIGQVAGNQAARLLDAFGLTPKGRMALGLPAAPPEPRTNPFLNRGRPPEGPYCNDDQNRRS